MFSEHTEASFTRRFFPLDKVVCLKVPEASLAVLWGLPSLSSKPTHLLCLMLVVIGLFYGL